MELHHDRCEFPTKSGDVLRSYRSLEIPHGAIHYRTADSLLGALPPAYSIWRVQRRLQSRRGLLFQCRSHFGHWASPGRLAFQRYQLNMSTNTAQTTLPRKSMATYCFVGHRALRLSMNRRRIPSCELSIATEAAAINRLGGLFERFARLEHLELRWTPMTGELDGILIPHNRRSKCVQRFVGSKRRCLPPCAISEVMPDKHA
jgi:hypothetical protein